jgi:serine-type D-Ala-D-Ala endopeptidase (penicillin-binding protein 7)
VAPFLERLCTATVGFPGVAKTLANSELFVRMPILLSNHRVSNELLPVISKRPTPIARFLCLLAAAIVFGLPSDTLAGQQTKSRSSGTATKKLSLKKTQAASKYSASSARKRRAARAAAAARALREAQEPRFKLDASGALVPDVRAEAAIIYDSTTGAVLWESNSKDQRSIASITKVMTAAVFVENSPDLSETVVIDRSDVRAASTTYLRAGYTVTKGDLLHLALIASDNAAARALARVSPYGTAGFIERMNEKAKELGLTNTHYADSSGLLSANVSSAYDMAKLITFVSGDERIASVMRKQNHTVTAGRRVINIHSTNQLVMRGDVDVQAGKTGFIRNAGYCLATLLRLPQGPQVAVVVLGAKSNAGRFWETRHLFNWFSTKAQDILGVAPVEAAELKPAAAN